jgi:hypothetical protein
VPYGRTETGAAGSSTGSTGRAGDFPAIVFLIIQNFTPFYKDLLPVCPEETGTLWVFAKKIRYEILFTFCDDMHEG